jgi:uncharacterized protein (UPF0264 family)
VTALEPLARAGMRLVAVLFGDCSPDRRLPGQLAAAGFAGCMLDTADKARGSLTQVCSISDLRQFIDEVRHHGLLCGLAGSLTTDDIAELVPLAPDYLGFRGALCRGHRRNQSLDAFLLRQVSTAVRAADRRSPPSRQPAKAASMSVPESRRSPPLPTT